MRTLATIWMCATLLWGQQGASAWQENVRRYADKQDWNGALQLLERELIQHPADLEARAWHARVLLWSGRVAEARQEFLEILASAPGDPDNWLGLAGAYAQEGQTKLATEALDRALMLDPSRADIHAARGREFRRQHRIPEARQEFQKALELNPSDQEARSGLVSLRAQPKHELRIGSETHRFSFTSASQNEELRLISQWSPHWETSAGVAGYRIAGIDAEKILGRVTAKSSKWGAVSMGAAAAHDNGIVPQHELLFDYDRGFRVRAGALRALELEYGQHWYRYKSARILTSNEIATLYFAQGWTWSVGLTEARSHFFPSETDWRPSGMARLGFPIVGGADGSLAGNLFFAAGTENFAQVDQIGRFSSQTYGGGLRLRLSATQDVRGFAAYQKRGQQRTDMSFGLNYGIRF